MTGPGMPDPDDPDLRAAEYVLGTLDARERAAVEREAARDPATRARIDAWEHRLSPLAEAVPAETPPPRIRAVLLQGVTGAGSAEARRIADLRAQLRRWRIAAGGAGLLAAGLALALLVVPFREPAGGRYLAVVQRGGTLPALIMRVDTRTGIAQVRPVGVEAPAGRNLELWYVGTEGPKPLGLVGAVPSRVTLPAGASPNGAIAVSVEPPGGSPTGQPTGPVIYTGKLIPE